MLYESITTKKKKEERIEITKQYTEYKAHNAINVKKSGCVGG